MSEYTVFDLMDDLERANTRRRVEEKIATMPVWEKAFIVGLLQHEERERGQVGIDDVLAWVLRREQEQP